MVNAPVPDGTYDVFVVDALGHPDRPGTVSSVEVTIVAGALKGEVLVLGSQGVEGSDVDVIGMPATLTVIDGVPALAIDSDA